MSVEVLTIKSNLPGSIGAGSNTYNIGPGLTPALDAAKSAKQLADPFNSLYSRNIALEPPQDPDLWALLTTLSTRLSQCLRSYARNVGGQGWKVVPTVEITRKTSKEIKDALQKDMDTLKGFYGHPHTARQSKNFVEESFAEILYKMVSDREATGNGYLEVSRDLSGIPAGAWHIPATTVRKRANLQGFIQYSAGRTEFVYFKNFGDPRIMDCRTGMFFGENGDNTPIPIEYQANEIIHFMLYSPVSTHYGLPRAIAAEMAVTGSRAAAERNRAFFINDAVPRMAVLVSGGSLSPETIEMMSETFSASSKGGSLAHRVIVLHAKPGMQGVTAAPKIELQPLTVGTADDAGFSKYREANDKEIREAFGLSELHLGSEGNANRASATVILRLVNLQELQPAIKEIEYRLNATITAAFGVRYAALELKKPKSTDPLDDAKILQRLIPAGALTPRDLREWAEEYLGIDLVPFTEEWTTIPYSLMLALVRSQMIEVNEQDEVLNSIKQLIEEVRSDVDEVQTALDTD